jgi:antitoxin FitA
MATMTVRNLAIEVHRAIRSRAAKNGRSAEAEVRIILEEAVRPAGRVKLGTLLAEIGTEAQLSEEEFAVFSQRDRTPGLPVDFGE